MLSTGNPAWCLRDHHGNPAWCLRCHHGNPACCLRGHHGNPAWCLRGHPGNSAFPPLSGPVPDGKVKLERFDRILNETALRLRMLRGSVESPALGGKIQRLRSAAQEQQGRLASIEADLQEISQERDSLKDITLNLPKSCPQPTGAG